MKSFLLTAALVLVTMAGCLDESEPTPEPAPTSLYTGDIGELNVPEPFTRFGDTHTLELPRGGQGIWIEEGILFHTNGRDLHVVDARDPRNMTVVAEVLELDGARDVDLLEWSGIRMALIAGSGNGMHIYNVTDPAAPEFMTTAPVLNAGVHNLAAIDGTPYVYVAGASAERKIDVVDLTDPFNPVVTFFLIPDSMPVAGIPLPSVQLNSNGCHDITVRYDIGRAYCAGGGSQYMSGGGESFVWDISDDPRNPVWLAAVDDPRIVYHHQAFVNDDGSLLIINDEYIGAYQVGAGANNCFHSDLPVIPAEAQQIPFAAAWIYDLTDESAPEYVSFVQNPSGWNGEGLPPNPLEGNCGAHFGDIIPGNDAFVMGWYEGGTLLVDFTDPANPDILDIAEPFAGETWDSMYYDGWVFHSSGDLVATQLV